MRWRGQRESENVEDRRDEGGGFGFPFPGGGGGRFPSGGGGGGGIGILGLLILLGLMFFFGLDPRVIMQPGGPGGGPGGDETNFPDIRLPQERPDTTNFPVPGQQGSPIERPQTTSEDDLKQFVAVVLADTEDVWRDLFARYGESYSDPKLVLFSGGVRSACGIGMAQMGPFYCPYDEKVYIDLDFYGDLKNRFGAPGDMAQAYVIAHEIGHHVQKLLGIADQVEALKQRMGQTQANALQVRMELQADCFAGIWANRAQDSKDIIEPGDIDDALRAASAIGDDRIQKQTQGYVVPDAFTHGSSEQRVRWFKRGYQSGKLDACDTFNSDDI
ncbi:MAG TPA: neutral zinc metallopeptidase [Methyloceanibacter sp.]|nr:neutral zinc metallopeptidase [Methyloceanibacter sp.]